MRYQQRRMWQEVHREQHVKFSSTSLVTEDELNFSPLFCASPSLRYVCKMAGAF